MPFVAIASLVLSQTVVKPMPRIGIRAFKAEHEMEIWGAQNDRGPFKLLAKYPIAAMSGSLGPKRREGDMQVPEGFYRIDRFNPHSLFHLSLGLNYPNSVDREHSDPTHPGKDIFIHGNQVSAGCMAMTDPVIDVVYGLADYARNHGQRSIPVSIFPCRMTPENVTALKTRYAQRPDLLRFWATLVPGYRSFERDHFWPRPHGGKSGQYTWPELR